MSWPHVSAFSTGVWAILTTQLGLKISLKLGPDVDVSSKGAYMRVNIVFNPP